MTMNRLCRSPRSSVLVILIVAIVSSSSSCNFVHGFIVRLPKHAKTLLFVPTQLLHARRIGFLCDTWITRYDNARKGKKHDRVLSSTPPFLRISSISSRMSSARTSSDTEATIRKRPTSTTTMSTIGNNKEQPAGTMIFLLSSSYSIIPRTSKFGTSSPVDSPSIYDAVRHLQYKISLWSQNKIQVQYYMIPNNNDNDNDGDAIPSSLLEADLVIAMGLRTTSDLNIASRIFRQRQTNRVGTLRQRQGQFAIDCSTDDCNNELLLPSFVSWYDPNNWFHNAYAAIIPWSQMGTSYRMYQQMDQLFCKPTNRHDVTTDDFCYAIMIFFHQYSGTMIEWVQYNIDATYEKGLLRNGQELYRMITKCNDCILDCIKDETCRTCLNELTKIDTRDQVMSYRTIVSYESTLLKEFSLCIFTKHNIFQCDAKIPNVPNVEPLTTFRGQNMTEEIARSLLVGHYHHPMSYMDQSLQKNTSWMVSCGANVAYDQFPCQYQIFYPTEKGRDMWYDPVFLVQTLNDNQYKWCHRHYKVRPQSMPGTFRFSTSDNGVTSDEFWTILDVDEDNLSWMIFHYAGAAKSVGLQYIGALLCTPDGSMPTNQQHLERIWSTFRRVGIPPWELYQVTNDVRNVIPHATSSAGDPPLDYYIQKRKKGF